ncbi:hypothetical protein CGRA01v4_10012 [Colletotrichum graminicola]|nr:hypothetical protein CGRA01v4_10012 [Colletotrichum graminicola]
MSWLWVAGGMWQAKYVYPKYIRAACLAGYAGCNAMCTCQNLSGASPLLCLQPRAVTVARTRFCLRLLNHTCTYCYCLDWTPAAANMISMLNGRREILFTDEMDNAAKSA